MNSRNPRKKTLIIAEAGVNYNGDIELAKKMVDVAAEAGADIVKFQTGIPEKVISRFAQKAEYQKKNTNDSEENQLDMARKLMLPWEVYPELISYCESKGIEFLSTPFEAESADFLHDLGVRVWKIPSGEITNLPLLIHIANYGERVILSTGMSTLEEVKKSYEILKENGAGDVTVLHCNTEYPTPFEDANIRAMQTIANELRVDVGYSDHTMGVEAVIAAVAMGASVVEKHFTLDRNMPGPDQKASIEPDELKYMVDAVRNVEKAIGDGMKNPSMSEVKNINIARKSIVAKRNILKGELLTDDNITCKRPGGGISPMKWFDVIGSSAIRDFQEDEMIEMDMRYKGKKLLFIGASGHFELAIKKAQELGAYAIVINNNDNAMAKKYADLAVHVDTYNPEEVLDFAIKNGVDGVFTSWNEVNLYTTAYVSKKMGIPFYANKEQLDALVTKYAFKQTCRKYDVPVIPEYYVGGGMCDEDVDRFEYPVIFKPTDSGGTRGMTILNDRNGVWEAYNNALGASIKKEVVVEKYLKNGQLIVIDFAVQNDKVYIASVADRSIVRTSEERVPLAISYMYPSKYIDIVEEQVLKPVTKLINGLKIHNGIISFEGIVSEGKLYLVETQFRFGGTHFYKFVEKDCGIDLLEMMIDYALTGKYDTYSFEGKINHRFSGLYACQNLQADPGRIVKVNNIDKVRALEGVDWFIQIKNINDSVPNDGSTAQNFAKIGLSADSEKELYRLMDKIQHTLEVLDENGNNLIRKNVPKEYVL